MSRTLLRSTRPLLSSFSPVRTVRFSKCAEHSKARPPPPSSLFSSRGKPPRRPPHAASFHTTPHRSAQPPTADALMENLNDLYATAKDEFEIAAEETEKKTVYAQDDRDAAREALTVLKEAFEKAARESDPDVGKEITARVGQRIRELENAVVAMEESAMED